jgi:hypothetical protein
MSADTAKPRPSTTARRVGYGVSAAINIVLLFLINTSPGWAAVPFLTERTADVIPLVNASLLVTVLVNLVQIIYDPRWLVALGSMITTTVGVAALVRMWQVFPFDFGTTAFNWPLVARIFLAVGIAGSLIALVVQAVTMIGARWHPPGRLT